MHWEDERWIKVYTRDTPEWTSLSWEARGIFLLLLRIVDRAGVLNLGRSGQKGLATMLRVPPDALADALSELEAVENVRLEDGRLVIPNHVEAQEARASPKERQAARRERNKAKKGDGESHAASRGVTHGHAESHDVTRRHAASHGVTTRLDVDEQETRQAEEKGTHPACAPASVRVATAAPTAAAKDDAPGKPSTDARMPAAQTAPAPMLTPSGDRASPAKPGPHAANPKPTRSGVTSDALRDLWRETCARPGVNLVAWTADMDSGRLMLLDGLAGTRPMDGPGGWREVLAKMALSDLCNGRVKGGWRADPAWLLKPSSVPDVLAGKYDAGPGPTTAPKQSKTGWAPASTQQHPEKGGPIDLG